MMKIIASPRQTGKTTHLIELAAAAEARREVNYIIVGSQREAYRVAQLAESKELNIGFPVTFDEFLHHQYTGQNIHHFYIDNAEMLIRCLTPVPIEAITINILDKTGNN